MEPAAKHVEGTAQAHVLQENVALSLNFVAMMHVVIRRCGRQDLAHHVAPDLHQSNNVNKAHRTNAATMVAFAKLVQSAAMVNVALLLKPAQIMFANLFDCNQQNITCMESFSLM